MNADTLVRSMYHEGSLRWSLIALPWDTFQRYCEELAEGRPLRPEVRSNAGDIYLCCACAAGNQAALIAFEREAHDLVHEAILRVHREPNFVAETQQEFWKKLLVGPGAKIRNYLGRGPLQVWLRVAATRLAIDRRRAECVAAGRETRDTELGECLAEQDFGPESSLTRARFYSAFREALQRAVLGLSKKERNLLRMHVLGHCSIDQIGRAYNVHRATAARWLEQVRERIGESVRQELELVGPPLTASEFRSVARVVGGDLDFELSAIQLDSTLQPSSPTR